VKWLPFVACYFIPRVRGFFFLFSLFFFPWRFLLWVFSALLVLSDASSYFCLSARFMFLGSFFTWVYFLLEPFSSIDPLGHHPRLPGLVKPQSEQHQRKKSSSKMIQGADPFGTESTTTGILNLIIILIFVIITCMVCQ
jgi:hypothetical protein